VVNGLPVGGHRVIVHTLLGGIVEIALDFGSAEETAEHDAEGVIASLGEFHVCDAIALAREGTPGAGGDGKQNKRVLFQVT
jgi:hypothetical protein